MPILPSIGRFHFFQSLVNFWNIIFTSYSLGIYLHSTPFLAPSGVFSLVNLQLQLSRHQPTSGSSSWIYTGGEVCTVFFDLSKAFDTVPHTVKTKGLFQFGYRSSQLQLSMISLYLLHIAMTYLDIEEAS